MNDMWQWMYVRNESRATAAVKTKYNTSWTQNNIQSCSDDMHIVFILLLTKENSEADGGNYFHLKRDYKMNMRHLEKKNQQKLNGFKYTDLM